MTNEVTEKDLNPNTLTKKLTLGAIGAGTLGIILFMIGKIGKSKTNTSGILKTIGKVCIAIGIYILALAVYFSQNDSPASPSA